METVLVFAFERAIINFAAILVGFMFAAWLLGSRLRRWGLGATKRSLVYALFGMVGGLLAYYSYDYAKDGQRLLALVLVGGAMYILCFFLALAITLFTSRRDAAANRPRA